MLRIIFYSHCKSNIFFDCLDTYYKCLTIPFDVLDLIMDVKKLFYSLYEEYAKFYGHSLNINIEQDAHSMQAPTNQVDKGYHLLFQGKITRFFFIINTKLDLRASKLFNHSL